MTLGSPTGVASSLAAFRTVGVSLLLLVLACTSPPRGELTSAESELIRAEIQQVLDDYVEAVKRKDLDAQLRFWSDSGELVFAGDGAILGGYDEWAADLKRYTDETEEWQRYDWHNIHIAPLSRDAASATIEFDVLKTTTDGGTWARTGSWTYVFKRFSDGWKVIQTNGHHIEP